MRERTNKPPAGLEQALEQEVAAYIEPAGLEQARALVVRDRRDKRGR